MPVNRPPATGDYSIDRQRHLAAVALCYAAAAERLTAPLERRHAVRDDRLRALVRIARERSPWHGRRLSGVDPERLTGGDLSAIPTMTKADVMDNWDEIVTDRRLTLKLANAHLGLVAEQGPAYLLDEYHVVATSGSLGRRGVFVWDFDGWIEMYLAATSAVPWLQRHGALSGEARWASIVATDDTHVTAAMRATFAGTTSMDTVRAYQVTEPTAVIVAGLNEFQPTFVLSYPSILHQLAVEATEGRLRIAPEAFCCTAEPMVDAARTAIEAAFRAPVLEYYGSSETGTIGHSSPWWPGLHLWEENGVYETVDEAGRPVPAGVPGARLLATNVVNQVMPLIRYELTDEVMFLAEANPGPWTGRRLAGVQGRLDDVLTYPGGVRVHPHVFEAVLERRPTVTEYRVRQTEAGAEVLVQAVSGLDVDAIARELADALAHLGIGDPQVTVRPVERLDRTGNAAKLRRFAPSSAVPTA